MTEIYFDNSATTKPCESCVKKILQMLSEKYANPSSLHAKGLEAEVEVEKARSIIAQKLNADSIEIYFTSGGTEANNIAFFGSVKANKKRGKKIITSAIEHSSVYSCAKELEKYGFEIVYLKPDSFGQISIKDLEKELDSNTILVSIMMVNNEVGSILPVDKIKSLIVQKKSPALFHIDAVQAFGKILVDVKKLQPDLLTVSAHKIYGPKGVGALYKKNKVNILPQTFGGEQQKKLRPGTEAVPLIAGFGAAVDEFILDEQFEKIYNLNQYFKQKILKIKNISINSPTNAIPHIINISTNKIKSETMLHFLSSKGIFISSGSACSKGKKSRVLSQMQLSEKQIDSSLRISFSKNNTKLEIDEFFNQLIFGMENLIHI